MVDVRIETAARGEPAPAIVAVFEYLDVDLVGMAGSYLLLEGLVQEFGIIDLRECVKRIIFAFNHEANNSTSEPATSRDVKPPGIFDRF